MQNVHHSVMMRTAKYVVRKYVYVHMHLLDVACFT